jgi:hypothetical protein
MTYLLARFEKPERDIGSGQRGVETLKTTWVRRVRRAGDQERLVTLTQSVIVSGLERSGAV